MDAGMGEFRQPRNFMPDDLGDDDGAGRQNPMFTSDFVYGPSVMRGAPLSRGQVRAFIRQDKRREAIALKLELNRLVRTNGNRWNYVGM